MNKKKILPESFMLKKDKFSGIEKSMYLYNVYES